MSITNTSKYVQHENVELVHDDLGDVFNGPVTFNGPVNIDNTFNLTSSALTAPANLTTTTGQTTKFANYDLLAVDNTNNDVYALPFNLALSTMVSYTGTYLQVINLPNVWTTLNQFGPFIPAPPAASTGVVLDSSTYFDFTNASGAIFQITVTIYFVNGTASSHVGLQLVTATLPGGPANPANVIAASTAYSGTGTTVVATVTGIFQTALFPGLGVAVQATSTSTNYSIEGSTAAAVQIVRLA